MEHDEVVLVLREGLHRVAGRVTVFLRPARPGRTVAVGSHRLRQRLEQGMEVERLALLGDEAVEVGDEALVAVVREDAARAGRARAA